MKNSVLAADAANVLMFLLAWFMFQKFGPSFWSFLVLFFLARSIVRASVLAVAKDGDNGR